MLPLSKLFTHWMGWSVFVQVITLFLFFVVVYFKKPKPVFRKITVRQAPDDEPSHTPLMSNVYSVESLCHN